MSVQSASIKLIITIAFLTTSVSGQSPTNTPPANSDKSTVVTPKASDLESQVAAVKAENAAFRESLRKMEEQQKVLLEMVDRLQRKLDGLRMGMWRVWISQQSQPQCLCVAVVN